MLLRELSEYADSHFRSVCRAAGRADGQQRSRAHEHGRRPRHLHGRHPHRPDDQHRASSPKPRASECDEARRKATGCI